MQIEKKAGTCFRFATYSLPVDESYAFIAPANRYRTTNIRKQTARDGCVTRITIIAVKLARKKQNKPQ